MLLAIDIGNTNIVLGVFQKNTLKGNWRIGTRLSKTPDEYGILIQDLFRTAGISAREVKGLILSSVVPPLTPVFVEMARRYFKAQAMVVDGTSDTGLTICCEPAADVGADRIVNAVAAYSRFGGPLIIVDFGTATTFCAVTQKGEYLGGAIYPGIGISAEALFQRTAKLPKVDLIRPKSVIGKDTVTSIQSGLFYGYAGMVDSMVSRMKKELGAGTRVVATGGQLERVLPEMKTVDEVCPFLTLDGLKILYEKKKPTRRGRLPVDKPS